MKKSLTAVNRYLERKFGTTVQMGISIHTGEVVVGNIGFEKKMDYTVIGDPVNTVFRLQHLTKSFPNGIVISENTLRAARSRPDVGEIKISSDLAQELGSMKVYELLNAKPEKTYALPIN
jgi:class 3 adenylate cyclase